MARLKLGVIVGLRENPTEAIQKVHDLGLPTCQLGCWSPQHYSRQNIRTVRNACRWHNVEISSIWAGYPGPAVWNFLEGPATIGLVPRKWRRVRINAMPMRT